MSWRDILNPAKESRPFCVLLRKETYAKGETVETKKSVQMFHKDTFLTEEQGTGQGEKPFTPFAAFTAKKKSSKASTPEPSISPFKRYVSNVDLYINSNDKALNHDEKPLTLNNQTYTQKPQKTQKGVDDDILAGSDIKSNNNKFSSLPGRDVENKRNACQPLNCIKCKWADKLGDFCAFLVLHPLTVPKPKTWKMVPAVLAVENCPGYEMRIEQQEVS